MAYALSFGPDFFRADTFDGHLTCDVTKRPTSVEQAVLQLSQKTWSRIARKVFDCEPEFLNVDAVLSKIEETNTCLNLDSPVEVFVDADGEFTVMVYDRDEA